MDAIKQISKHITEKIESLIIDEIGNSVKDAIDDGELSETLSKTKVTLAGGRIGKLGITGDDVAQAIIDNLDIDFEAIIQDVVQKHLESMTYSFNNPLAMASFDLACKECGTTNGTWVNDTMGGIRGSQLSTHEITKIGKKIIIL